MPKYPVGILEMRRFVSVFLLVMRLFVSSFMRLAIADADEISAQFRSIGTSFEWMLEHSETVSGNKIDYGQH